MKKINNIFNRHTAEGRCPGIAIAMTCPAGDFSSQGDEKHNVCDASFCIRKNWIPAFAGMTMIVIAALFATPSFATPTELDKKTVASKAYVDTKQDKITTDVVTFREPEEQIDYTVPALVSYGTGTNNADGVLGNKIGILDMNKNLGGLNSYDFLDLWDDEESGYLDNFVPTVRAVSAAIQIVWASMPNSWQALSWSVNNDDGANRTNAINAYNKTFGSGTNNWAGTNTHLIDGQFLANSLALKQNKIDAQNTSLVLGQQVGNGVPSSVIAPTGTAGVVQQVALWDADSADSTAWDINDYYSTNTVAERTAIRNSIPTVGAVEVGLNQKQNRITTGLVGFDYFQTPYNLPAITTYDSTSGLVANKIGMLNQASIENLFGLGSLPEFFDSGATSDENYDKLVPTVAAVMGIHMELNNKIDRKQYKLPAAWTGTTGTSNLGSTGGQTIDLTATQGSVGRRYITAGGSQPLTQKTGADNVILYINGTKTLAQYQTSNFGGTGDVATTNQNYIKGALVSLELLKDVYGELNAKITNNALPTGTTGTVVTYNGTNATTGVQEFGERAVYDPANAYNAQNDATKLATMASVKYECAGYEAGHENDPDYCWLWALPN